MFTDLGFYGGNLHLEIYYFNQVSVISYILNIKCHHKTVNVAMLFRFYKLLDHIRNRSGKMEFKFIYKFKGLFKENQYFYFSHTTYNTQAYSKEL